MNISFIIPVKIDNPIRLKNLDYCLLFLISNFSKAEIIVVESDSESKIESVKVEFPNVKFIFVKESGRFCKSKVINIGLKNSTTPIVTVWDLDVLLNPMALLEGYKLILEKGFKAVLPHNTFFINIKGELKEKFIKSHNFNTLPYICRNGTKPKNEEYEIHCIPSGVVMFDRKILLAVGGYNKNMVSYGWEDIEILKRLNKLGFYYYIMGKYNIIHLDHPRGNDSSVNEYFEINRQEFLNVIKMNKKKLTEYISNNLKSWINWDDEGIDLIIRNPNLCIFDTIFYRSFYQRIKYYILKKI